MPRRSELRGRNPFLISALGCCVCLALGGCLKPLTGHDVDAGADIAARFLPHKDTQASLDDQWVIAPLDASEAVDAAEDATAAAADVTATDSGSACGDGTCNGPEWCATCAADCGTCPKACAPLTSLGCAPGSQCYPNPPDNLCAVPGSAKVGGVCKSWNDCEFATLCILGTCRALCDASGTDSAAACKPGVACEKLVFDGGDEVAADLGACEPGDACDPLSDAGCGAGKTCVPFGWLKTCTPAGSLGAGQACAGDSACLQGLLCVDGACRLRCHTGGGEPACAASACVALLGPDGSAVPGQVGWCK